MARVGPFYYVINGCIREVHVWQSREECAKANGMADKFECDSCKQTFAPEEKKGSITLDAIGSNFMPSINPKIKLDLCTGCFDKYHAQFIAINPQLAPFRG